LPGKLRYNSPKSFFNEQTASSRSTTTITIAQADWIFVGQLSVSFTFGLTNQRDNFAGRCLQHATINPVKIFP